jgi:hypothetical protein
MCVPSFSQRRAVPAKSTLSVNKQLLMSLPPLKFDANFFYPPLPELQSSTSPTALSDNKHTHIIVQHDYHDRATETVSYGIEEIQTTRGGVAVPFPPKLHEMLQQVQEEGLEHIVSWQPHGRCFLVHDPKGFVDIVLPKYFKQSKLASFQRQLNLYGFQRLTKGNDKGGYYHEYFLRNRTDLCSKIHRLKVKGTGVRARSNPEQEPDLWKMSWITSDGVTTSNDQEAQQIPSRVSSEASLAPKDSLLQQQLQDDLEDLFFFEGRAFHALESAEPSSVLQQATIPAVDESLDFDDADIDTILSDMKLPGNFHLDIIDSIDDDIAFGNLLERLIDEQ